MSKITPTSNGSPTSASARTLANCNIQNIDKLVPVHYIILNFLKETIPVKLLCVSRKLYDELVPKVYKSIVINKDSVHGILAGLENPSTSAFTRKSDVLRMVQTFIIEDYPGLRCFGAGIRDPTPPRLTSDFCHVHVPSVLFCEMIDVIDEGLINGIQDELFDKMDCSTSFATIFH